VEQEAAYLQCCVICPHYRPIFLQKFYLRKWATTWCNAMTFGRWQPGAMQLPLDSKASLLPKNQSYWCAG